jgi:hypothetical protein
MLARRIVGRVARGAGRCARAASGAPKPSNAPSAAGKAPSPPAAPVAAAKPPAPPPAAPAKLGVAPAPGVTDTKQGVGLLSVAVPVAVAAALGGLYYAYENDLLPPAITGKPAPPASPTKAAPPAAAGGTPAPAAPPVRADKPAPPPSSPTAVPAAKPAPAEATAKPASPPAGAAAKPASPPAGAAAKPASPPAGAAAKPAAPAAPPRDAALDKALALARAVEEDAHLAQGIAAAQQLVAKPSSPSKPAPPASPPATPVASPVPAADGGAAARPTGKAPAPSTEPVPLAPASALEAAKAGAAAWKAEQVTKMLRQEARDATASEVVALSPSELRERVLSLNSELAARARWEAVNLIDKLEENDARWAKLVRGCGVGWEGEGGGEACGKPAWVGAARAV